jgi:DNA end-binding protein Ku
MPQSLYAGFIRCDAEDYNQYMPNPKPPELPEEATQQEESIESIPGHPTWSGSISIGLVNIPVRTIPLTIDKKVSFRMLHQKCKTPISYKIFCQEGDEVSKSEIAYGYRLKGHEYLVFDKKEIDSAKPESSKVIDLDKFVNFFSVDPHYFERTWLLIPNNAEKPYALLRKTLDQTAMAAIGKMTMSTKESAILIHYYRDAVVATALRDPDEMRDLFHIPELENLPEPDEEDLADDQDCGQTDCGPGPWRIPRHLQREHGSTYQLQAERRGCASGREEAQEA